MNSQDNDTKIAVAQINAEARLEDAAFEANSFNKVNGNQTPESVIGPRKELEEKMRQFNLKYKLDKEKLQLEREKIKAQKNKPNKKS